MTWDLAGPLTDGVIATCHQPATDA